MSDFSESVETFKFLVKNKEGSDHSCGPFSRKMLKLILSIVEPVVTKVHSKLRYISRLENFPEIGPCKLCNADNGD